MIIIKVQGGLGNQLLQYSIGYVIAHEYGKEVAYDLSFFEQDTKYTKRPYLLDKFNLEVRVATKEEIENVRYPYGKISRFCNLFVRALNKYFLKKYYIAYDKNFFTRVKNNDRLYLEGFWQSYQYYKGSLKGLSQVITLKDVSGLTRAQQMLSFKEKTTVSIHIRRGDFLNANAGTQVVPKEYYEHAVPLLEKNVTLPTYYIFSDDIEWVKETLGYLFKDTVYVSGPQGLHLTDWEEFALMKECTHAIISNSTFSWLATLLTNRNDKVVFYPNDWKNDYLNKSSGICPPAWVGV